MTIPVQERLHDFAATLLERRGALVEWPASDRAGTAVLPPEVAAAVGTAEDVVSLACDAPGGGLAVNLAGDFLEWSGRLLGGLPQIGDFRVRDLYLKRKELHEGIERTFTWLNAKVRLREARETTIEYHTWWFHAAINSEDRWESCFSLSLNAASGVAVEIPDPFELWELQANPRPPAEPPAGYSWAVAVARRRVLRLAAAFFDRMDGRLQRDRKRLRDYYQALVRESEKKKARGHAPPDPEKIEATKRAVGLELRRKLAELDERYAMEAVLRPVVLVRTKTPALAVDVSVFRKQAHKMHTVYWNPLVKQFDPFRCSVCGESTFAVAFSNEEVEPLCQGCNSIRRPSS
jgi:hypothetical protein